MRIRMIDQIYIKGIFDIKNRQLYNSEIILNFSNNSLGHLEQNPKENGIRSVAAESESE